MPGALVAADRGDRRFWLIIVRVWNWGLLPVTTAPVVAQVSRSRRQAQLHRVLRGCSIEPFVAEQAHVVGSLLAAAGARDVVDAHVVLVAAGAHASVLTSDPEDLRRCRRSWLNRSRSAWSERRRVLRAEQIRRGARGDRPLTAPAADVYWLSGVS